MSKINRDYYSIAQNFIEKITSLQMAGKLTQAILFSVATGLEINLCKEIR
jgi:hypothetical protein